MGLIHRQENPYKEKLLDMRQRMLRSLLMGKYQKKHILL